MPHRYARAEVDARFTARTVEVFLRGERIATHRRGSGDGKHTTVADHMPSSHRRYADWTIERIGREADAIGPSVSILCTLILERRPHPEQGFRACLGILRLVRSVPAGRLDAATARAIEIGALTYGSVKSILNNKLDQLAAEPRPAEHQPVRHRNIRGRERCQRLQTDAQPGTTANGLSCPRFRPPRGWNGSGRYRRLSACPRHQVQAASAIEAFRELSPPVWTRSGARRAQAPAA